MSQPLLSILIPTTFDRAIVFNRLYEELKRQADCYKDLIEIHSICDDKRMSVGAKRNALYNEAKGKYSVQWDSDDWISPNGIDLIMSALQYGEDCCTYRELCMINGEEKYSNFNLLYDDWHDNPDWPAGFHYARTPFFKTPIKTDLCKMVGVKDLRYAEDHQFARDIKPILKSQVYIPEYIYHYIHNSKPEDHHERYGFNK